MDNWINEILNEVNEREAVAQMESAADWLAFDGGKDYNYETDELYYD